VYAGARLLAHKPEDCTNADGRPARDQLSRSLPHHRGWSTDKEMERRWRGDYGTVYSVLQHQGGAQIVVPTGDVGQRLPEDGSVQR
jgi:hypothetical protein